MQQRRLIEIIFGILFLLVAVMTLFEVWWLALLLGAIGAGLLAHQVVLGRRARRARPAPIERQRPDDRRWRRSEWSSLSGQEIGDLVSSIVQTSIRTASQRGIEAGFRELERQIEDAVNPPRRAPEPPAPPEARPRPKKVRRAQLVTLSSDEAYAHAVDAARAAGLELSRTAVLPVDVGLITFLPGDERAIHRTTPIEHDAQFVQPFVQLNMPTRAVGRIRYEIIDSDGQALFIHEDHQSLNRGVNLLTPPARLRAHDGMPRYGDWRLVISADDVPLLDHAFGWLEDPRARLRRHLHEDGELTPEARNILEDEISSPGMSLDDLLGAQGNNAGHAGRR
jgi:hypothetical protein